MVGNKQLLLPVSIYFCLTANDEHLGKSCLLRRSATSYNLPFYFHRRLLSDSLIAAANLTAVSEENIEPTQSFQESETLIARPKQSTPRKRRKITDPTDKLLEKAVNASQEALKSLKQQREPDNASRFGEIIAEKLRLLGDTLDVEVKILAVINTALKEKSKQQVHRTSNVGVGQTTL